MSCILHIVAFSESAPSHSSLIPSKSPLATSLFRIFRVDNPSSNKSTFQAIIYEGVEPINAGQTLIMPLKLRKICHITKRYEEANLNPETNCALKAIRNGDELVLLKTPKLKEEDEGERLRKKVEIATKSLSGIDAGIDQQHPGFSCARCRKVFSTAEYRDKHLKYTRCVDNGDRKFPCSLCSRFVYQIPKFCPQKMFFFSSFEKRDRLRIHVLHVHENHRPHVCRICTKAFSQSSSLNKVQFC